LFRFSDVSVCISAAPAALDRYLAAVPAMSLIPFTPFSISAFQFFSKGCLDLTPVSSSSLRHRVSRGLSKDPSVGQSCDRHGI